MNHRVPPDDFDTFEAACRAADAKRNGKAATHDNRTEKAKAHVRNGRVRFTQAKNEHRNPVEIDIPAHPDLLATIAATPSKHLTFLITDYGKPFTPAGFGNAMRDWCDQANLHHCSAHGLRKACATVLAEAGATTHEIAAVTGHQSLEEIERYTRAAERKRLADQAMKKFKA